MQKKKFQGSKLKRRVGESEPLRISLQQTVLLSTSLSGILDFAIHNKTDNLKKALVIIRTYNEHERIEKEDSVNILSSSKWQWNRLISR